MHNSSFRQSDAAIIFSKVPGFGEGGLYIETGWTFVESNVDGGQFIGFGIYCLFLCFGSGGNWALPIFQSVEYSYDMDIL